MVIDTLSREDSGEERNKICVNSCEKPTLHSCHLKLCVYKKIWPHTGLKFVELHPQRERVWSIHVRGHMESSREILWIFWRTWECTTDWLSKYMTVYCLWHSRSLFPARLLLPLDPITVHMQYSCNFSCRCLFCVLQLPTERKCSLGYPCASGHPMPIYCSLRPLPILNISCRRT